MKIQNNIQPIHYFLHDFIFNESSPYSSSFSFNIKEITLKKRTFDFTLIVLLSIFLLTSCKYFLESDEELALVLERGHYQKISESPEGTKYSIEFDYFVKGVECKVGGYHIKWDEHRSGIVNWYMMKTIIPGQIYTISDTFKLSYVLTSDPIIAMTGYLYNETDVLGDQLTLKKK